MEEQAWRTNQTEPLVIPTDNVRDVTNVVAGREKDMFALGIAGVEPQHHCFELIVGVFFQLASVDKVGQAIRSIEACALLSIMFLGHPTIIEKSVLSYEFSALLSLEFVRHPTIVEKSVLSCEFSVLLFIEFVRHPTTIEKVS